MADANVRAAILTLTEALDATGRLLFRSDLSEREKHERAREIAIDIFGPSEEPNPFHHPLVRAALSSGFQQGKDHEQR